MRVFLVSMTQSNTDWNRFFVKYKQNSSIIPTIDKRFYVRQKFVAF